MEFYILILHIVMEGTVSQNFDMGPTFHYIYILENNTFHFIYILENNTKNHKKLPLFSNKIRTKP